MSKLITAVTKLDPSYPGFVNVTREDDGFVVLTVRGDPKKVDGVYICGYARDKGQPGRCTPGDVHCNNYCNMAPEKGPMQKAPLDCTQVIEGAVAAIRLNSDDFGVMLASAIERIRGEPGQ